LLESPLKECDSYSFKGIVLPTISDYEDDNVELSMLNPDDFPYAYINYENGRYYLEF